MYEAQQSSMSHAAARCTLGRYSMTASFDESTSATLVIVFAEVPSIIPKVEATKVEKSWV